MAEQHGLDVEDELRVLEQKLDALREETYRNLTAVERVQLARHPKRPFTLDYIDRAFTTSSSCTATARSATTRRSSAAGRASTAAASWSSATRRAAT
jgi:acetyl-CoA carboxylase alpha subunit